MLERNELFFTCVPLSSTVAVVVNWHSALSTSLNSESFKIATLSESFKIIQILTLDQKAKQKTYDSKNNKNQYTKTKTKNYQNMHILKLDL